MKYILVFALLFGALFQAPEAQAMSCAVDVDKAYKSSDSSAVWYVSKSCKKKAFRNADYFFTYFGIMVRSQSGMTILLMFLMTKFHGWQKALYTHQHKERS